MPSTVMAEVLIAGCDLDEAQAAKLLPRPVVPAPPERFVRPGADDRSRAGGTQHFPFA